ncbi:hypothetical protein PCC7424_3929 [Gloeothece citriformis PCC 7424]|uniref:Uncharacterized protein n=1 Tax=Gloeothece citriformis (strain PCC 7424) TaxID=65393 RepID=B7KKH2_GLOC7|nr:hypothetical protein [Gloeothece citriformis]ACK72305.1 hypothetical protein PCC7424_3929 [Gloeothece citriformis PCC 7424]
MTRLEKPQTIRTYSPKPPKGWKRFRWYGLGLIWMISSVGSGSVLFTPRIGSHYGYNLLWLIPIIVFFMWVMIREVGWYTAVTGKTIVEGYNTLPTPIVVFLTLYLNRVQLPNSVQPGRFSFISMILSGLFFTGFGVLYFFNL